MKNADTHEQETFSPLPDKCLRDNVGKPKLSYNLLGTQTESAVWEMGGIKYSRGNWLKGREWTECADSLIRHLVKFLDGHDLDEESGLPHVDHITCCAKILAHSFHHHKQYDDR